MLVTALGAGNVCSSMVECLVCVKPSTFGPWYHKKKKNQKVPNSLKKRTVALDVGEWDKKRLKWELEVLVQNSRSE